MGQFKKFFKINNAYDEALSQARDECLIEDLATAIPSLKELSPRQAKWFIDMWRHANVFEARKTTLSDFDLEELASRMNQEQKTKDIHNIPSWAAVRLAKEKAIEEGKTGDPFAWVDYITKVSPKEIIALATRLGFEGWEKSKDKGSSSAVRLKKDLFTKGEQYKKQYMYDVSSELYKLAHMRMRDGLDWEEALGSLSEDEIDAALGQQGRGASSVIIDRAKEQLRKSGPDTSPEAPPEKKLVKGGKAGKLALNNLPKVYRDTLNLWKPVIQAIYKNPDAKAEEIQQQLKTNNIDIIPTDELLKYAVIDRLKELRNKIKTNQPLDEKEQDTYKIWQDMADEVKLDYEELAKKQLSKGPSSDDPQGVQFFAAQRALKAYQNKSPVDLVSPETFYNTLGESTPLYDKDSIEVDMIKKAKNDILTHSEYSEKDDMTDKDDQNAAQQVLSWFKDWQLDGKIHQAAEEFVKKSITYEEALEQVIDLTSEEFKNRADVKKYPTGQPREDYIKNSLAKPRLDRAIEGIKKGDWPAPPIKFAKYNADEQLNADLYNAVPTNDGWGPGQGGYSDEYYTQIMSAACRAGVTISIKNIRDTMGGRAVGDWLGNHGGSLSDFEKNYGKRPSGSPCNLPPEIANDQVVFDFLGQSLTDFIEKVAQGMLDRTDQPGWVDDPNVRQKTAYSLAQSGIYEVKRKQHRERSVMNVAADQARASAAPPSRAGGEEVGASLTQAKLDHFFNTMMQNPAVISQLKSSLGRFNSQDQERLTNVIRDVEAELAKRGQF